MALDESDKTWIRGEIEASDLRLRERIETMETRLLTAFQKWASPVDARIRSHSATLRALDLEQEVLTDRVTKLEGGAQ